MATYPNGWIHTLTRARPIGGAGSAYQTSGRVFGDRHNRFASDGWSKTIGAAPVSGSYAPVAWVLPRTAGAISSSAGNRLAITVATMPGQIGRQIDGSIALSLTVNNAPLSLIVLADGTATLTLTVDPASLGAAINIDGSTSAALTVDTPILGALAGLFGSATVTVTPSGTIVATGALAGSILPYTELSPENLANAVIAAAQESPLYADVRKINANDVIGTGTTGDSWRGVGVSP